MKNVIPRDLWDYRIGDLFYQLLYEIGAVGGNHEKYLHIKGLGKCLPISSGRAALVIAIKSLRLPPGARIGVPLFCCPVVFEAIERAGGQPVFIDCDKDTFCLSVNDLEKKVKNLNGLIVVHMFGNPANMDEILYTARNIPVIEDCAQALGSRYNNKALGQFGKISMFSFRSGKYISAGEGGAIFSNDQKIHEECARIVRLLPKPNIINEIKHLIMTATKSYFRQRPLYGLIGRRIWGSISNYGKISKRESISLSTIYKSDLALIKKRLRFLDMMVQNQRKIASIYLQELEIDKDMMCWEKPSTYYNRFYFPITFPSKQMRDRMAEFLLINNIDSMKYLDGLIPVARKHFGYEGGCPVSETLSERVLNLPCYYNLAEHEVEMIIKAFNSSWNKMPA
ncbi:MAG: DegT/DnrJ/EryC1/StrS family aminotransferase [Candidatus Saccharicenans sp.]